MHTTPLGYIGLGLMGGPMTRRLLAAGRTVTVWNRSAEKLDAAVSAGTQRAGSPAEVAERAEIIFLNLTDTAAVETVVFGPDGLSSARSEGKLVVDFSSIRPDATVEIARRLEAQNGMRWVDAPVSGGTKGAVEGSLAIMAGGDRRRYRARATAHHDHGGAGHPYGPARGWTDDQALQPDHRRLHDDRARRSD
jgi:3-hydroxyisobutyrate dehydrogenase